MMIPIKEGAVSGTAASPEAHHVSSLTAASSPPHALTVSSQHHVDRWTLGGSHAILESDKDRWAKPPSRSMWSLSEPTEKSSLPYALIVADPHCADYWPMNNIFTGYGSGKGRWNKLLLLMQSLSEPDANSMAKVGIVLSPATFAPISELTGNRNYEFYTPDGVRDEVHDDLSSLRGAASQNAHWLRLRHVPASSVHLSRTIESVKLIGHWHPDLRDSLRDLDRRKAFFVYTNHKGSCKQKAEGKCIASR